MQKILHSFRSLFKKKDNKHFSTEIHLNFIKILKDTVRFYAVSYVFALIIVFNTPDMSNKVAIINFHNIYIYQPSIFSVIFFLRWISEIIHLKDSPEYHGWIEKVRKKTFSVSNLNSASHIPYAQEEFLREQNLMLNSIHEAGHVVAAFLLDVEVEYVTASGTNGGATHLAGHFNINFVENLRKTILIDYASSVAEKMILGFVSGGSFGGKDADFEKARREIKQYLAQKDFQEHSDVGHVLTYMYADLESSETINAEYIKLLRETEQKFYKECTLLLQEHRLLILNIADELAKKERLSRKEIKSIIQHTMTQFTKATTQEDLNVCDV